MKQNLFKTMLLAVLFCILGGMKSWGYSTSLSESYSVIGYKNPVLYNFLKDSSTLPTSGDLRYRDSNFGLFNYGRAKRDATISISLKKDQLVIVNWFDTQGKAGNVCSIANCTVTTDYE